MKWKENEAIAMQENGKILKKSNEQYSCGSITKSRIHF